MSPRRPRSPSGLLPALLLAGPALACGRGGGPAPDAPRLVVLYATCTLNEHFLSPYEPSVPFTPALEAFAREGVVFRRHTTEADQSGPSFAALYTGVHADRHGVYHHPTELRQDLHLVAESFADAGYETFFWNGHRMASARLGYDQGVPPENTFSGTQLDKGILTGQDPRFQGILERLAEDPDYRAYVQINFTLTHAPYQRYSPEHLTARFCRRYPSACAGVTPEDFGRFLPLYDQNRHELQYDFPEARERLGLSDEDVERLAGVLELTYSSCVANLDRHFGQFVDAIRAAGAMDECLFAFTADHGEVLWRPNTLFHWCHGGELVPEVVDVPWILHAPGLEPGDYEGVTRSIDVYPTLVGLCGIRLSAGSAIEGRDLSPVLRGEEPEPDLVGLSRTTTLIPSRLELSSEWSVYHAFNPRTDPELLWVRARRGDTTYKWRDWGGGDWHLGVFDLARDPYEEHDLFDPSNGEHLAMRDLLLAYKARLVEGFDPALVDAPVDPEAEEDLRALGYVR